MAKMKALGNINLSGEFIEAGKKFTIDDNELVRDLMASGAAELVIEQAAPPPSPPEPEKAPQPQQGQGERGK